MSSHSGDSIPSENNRINITESQAAQMNERIGGVSNYNHRHNGTYLETMGANLSIDLAGTLGNEICETEIDDRIIQTFETTQQQKSETRIVDKPNNDRFYQNLIRKSHQMKSHRFGRNKEL